MKKKTLWLLFAGLALSACAPAVSAQHDGPIYALYCVYAAGEEQPSTYEEWLETIKGENGVDGVNGLYPEIGSNGNWWIGDYDTGIPVNGEKGDQGQPGEPGDPGRDGYVPTHGENGNWWIGEEDTGIPYFGENGEVPIIEVGASGTWVIDGVDTGIKATYGEETCTLSFDPNGGTFADGEGGDLEVKLGSFASDLPVPKKKGRTFLGWWTDFGINGAQLSPYVPVMRDLSLVAKWNAYDVFYVNPDGEVIDGYEVAHGEEVPYCEIIPSYRAEDGGDYVFDGFEEVPERAYEDLEIKALFHLTTESEATIALDPGFGYFEEGTETVFSSSINGRMSPFEGEFPVPEIDDPDLRFFGWFYEDGGEVDFDRDVIGSDLTLTAKFLPRDFKEGDYAITPQISREIDEFRLVEGGYQAVYRSEEASKHALLVVPSTHRGKPVVSFRSHALHSQSTPLAGLLLPESVTSVDLGTYDLSCLRYLSSSALPSSLSGLANNLVHFLGGKGLEEIPSSFFENAANLKSAYFEEGLREVGKASFRGLSSLSRLQLPFGVETIGEEAFRGTSLSKLYFTEETTSIGSMAFADCLDLAVYAYLDGPLAGWTGVADSGSDLEVYYQIPQTYLEEGGLRYYLYENASASEAWVAGTDLRNQTLSIPDTLGGVETKGIVAYAFEDTALTFSSIPDGLRYIGKHAFAGTAFDDLLVLGESVRHIGAKAFLGASLAGHKAFVSQNVSYLGKEAFKGSEVPFLLISDASVRPEGWNLGYDEDELIEVYDALMPTSFRDGMAFAFSDEGEPHAVLADFRPEKSSLDFYDFPSFDSGYDCTEIGAGAFYGADVAEAYLPSGYTKIGAYAFADFDSQGPSSFSMGPTEIGTKAFAGREATLYFSCPQEEVHGEEGWLEGVVDAVYDFEYTEFVDEASHLIYTLIDGLGAMILRPEAGHGIPETFPERLGGMDVTLIYDGAFEGVGDGTVPVVLPRTIRSIGYRAFAGVNAPYVVIQNPYAEYPFYAPDCFEGFDGYLFFGGDMDYVDEDKTARGKMFGNVESVSSFSMEYEGFLYEGLSYSVWSLGSDHPFGIVTSITPLEGNENPTSLVVPEALPLTVGQLSLESYCPEEVPAWMSSLERADLRHITRLGDGAFENCTALREATFGEELAFIGERTFKGCSSLTGLYLPQSLIAIGSEAFYTGAEIVLDCGFGEDLSSLLEGTYDEWRTTVNYGVPTEELA